MAIKITDSFFVNNGDTTKVQLRYPKPGVIIMQTPKNEYRLNKNGTVERNDGVDWVIPVTEDPDYHKNLILQADKNKTNQPVNILKYYWNKIFKNEQGGIMNYAEYLQQGGTAQPSIEEQVAQLVQAAMSGDQEAGQQIEQIMQAAQQGDPKAQQLAQLIQQIAQKLKSTQQPTAMKCGGKVRAKVKKACGGKKMEKGGEASIKKEAKGGKQPCPCTLHRVGGKLIEVDCNGVPVHYAQQGDNTGNWFTRLVDRFASAARQSGANYTPGAGSIAGSIVDGTPSGIVGSPAQESTGNNGVQAQNQRLTTPKQSGNFIAWLKENAPEYVGLNKRRELAAKYGISSANGYTGSLEQNLALWDKMRQDKQKGIQFGGPDVQRIESSAALNPTRITVDNATASAPLAVTRNGDIVRTSSLTTGQALSQLNTPAWEEYSRRLRQGILSSKNGGKMSYADYLK